MNRATTGGGGPRRVAWANWSDKKLLAMRIRDLGLSLEGSWLEGRSRFARLGLMIHVTAGFVAPGIDNRQVLEISNLSGRELRIHPGTRLCQIVLQRTEGEAVYRGRFANQLKP